MLQVLLLLLDGEWARRIQGRIGVACDILVHQLNHADGAAAEADRRLADRVAHRRECGREVGREVGEHCRLEYRIAESVHLLPRASEVEAHLHARLQTLGQALGERLLWPGGSQGQAMSLGDERGAFALEVDQIDSRRRRRHIATRWSSAAPSGDAGTSISSWISPTSASSTSSTSLHQRFEAEDDFACRRHATLVPTPARWVNDDADRTTVRTDGEAGGLLAATRDGHRTNEIGDRGSDARLEN